MSSPRSRLPYNPELLPRELAPNYIVATNAECNEMLAACGHKRLEDLYSHISDDVKSKPHSMTFQKAQSYDDLIVQVEKIAAENSPRPSFIGAGLPHYKIPKIVDYVGSLRGLATAYTPYQPERSQGTLSTLWIYSNSISALTGFEAVNASMYDRSTAMYEAMNTVVKLSKGKTSILIASTLHPTDLEVLCTLSQHTELKFINAPFVDKTGTLDLHELKSLIATHKSELAGILFPQVNLFGNLEDVNTITDLATEAGIISVAVIDPILLSSQGLIPPSEFGSNKQGTNIFVAEGQHLALAPNFGGPGLGIFGIRFNEKDQLSIRSTPGRFIGKGKDESGQEALAMVLSTREQHIRREKATSNICSNQSFIATLAGAALLERGDIGLSSTFLLSRKRAVAFAELISSLSGVELAFPETPFCNEVTLKLSTSASLLIEEAREKNLHLAANLSGRTRLTSELLQVCFTDNQTDKEIEALHQFFRGAFNSAPAPKDFVKDIPSALLRKSSVNLKQHSFESLKEYYSSLDAQNISPDNAIYPLGSCTMKYNPYINEYAAALKGITDLHPEAPRKDSQGSLRILFETQEIFKQMTGLDAVTTQPVAGAHGEWVALKLFQAYHKEFHPNEERDTILIPASAHGTNPASATSAGYKVVIIKPLPSGEVDIENLKEMLTALSSKVAGIMVTNPNTSGVFEKSFKEFSKLVREAGGLVYMDGANMNAIAGWIDLKKMGVDAIHNNLHKTWSIPHGGGGPGDAIVAVDEKLAPYLPGFVVVKEKEHYRLQKPAKSIGMVHRHFGNFAHKMRSYAYLKALGPDGIRQMSAVAVLSSNYLYQELRKIFPVLPFTSENEPRMHEFIITLEKEEFEKLEKAGVPKANAIARVGKLFLDFGLHAPTVAFPEVYGLMIEPTESYSKAELDRFIQVMKAIKSVINEIPEVLTTVPHFTPIVKVDEISANKTLVLSEKNFELPKVYQDKISPKELGKLSPEKIREEILKAHNLRKGGTK